MSARKCGFCKQIAELFKDNPDRRLYVCPACGATEAIFKSRQLWWYDGWRHDDGRHVAY